MAFQAAIFAYIGLDLFGSRGADPDHLNTEGEDVCSSDAELEAGDCLPRPGAGSGRAGFVTFCVVLVAVARVAIVPPLVMLCNTWRRRKPITRNMGIAIVCAGLRGAIAFALAKNIHSCARPRARRSPARVACLPRARQSGAPGAGTRE